MNIKNLLVLCGALVAASSVSSAATVSCTVTSGTVLTSTLGGLGYSISNGIGTSTGGATGVITCPAISVGIGFINNYQVLATVDYQNGPSGTTSGTQVNQMLTLVGGSLNGSSVAATLTGGESPTSVVPPVPFQIGSTLSGATSYAAFSVIVNSSVPSGSVGSSTGQVVISYEVATNNNPTIPEPSTYGLMFAGLASLGWFSKRRPQR